jgi:acyl carrier protein
MTEIATDELETFVFDTLADFGPEREDVRRDATLDELDIDSLDVVELSQIVEEKYEIGLKAEIFEGSRTVGDLIDRIAGAAAG